MLLYQCGECGTVQGYANPCRNCYSMDLSIEGFVLVKNEAQAIVKELGQTFVSRDNELCKEVLNKLERFVNDNA